MAADVTKKVELNISVKGLTATDLKPLDSLTGKLKSVQKNLETFQKALDGIKVGSGIAILTESLNNLSSVNATKIEKISQSLNNIAKISIFPDIKPFLSNLEKLSSISLTNLQNFSVSLQTFIKTTSGVIDSAKNLTVLITVLDKLKGVTKLPDLSKVATQLQQLINIKFGPSAQNLRTFVSVLQGFSSVKFPRLTTFISGIQALVNLPVQTVTTKLKDLSLAIANLDKAGYISSFKTLATDLNKLSTLMSQSVTATAKVQKALRDTGIAAEQSGKKIQGFGNHLKTVIEYRSIFAALQGVVTGFQGAWTAIRDYDQALKDLQAITQSSTYEVELMGKKILEVASSTKFSAVEVAEGMKVIGQAGFTAAESIKIIQGVADLATGTLSDMPTAIDLVTTTLRVFNLDASRTAEIADVFSVAINRSKLTIDKLRTAMLYVGPIAESSGISFKDLSVAMMQLANSGLRASQIGTGLRRVFAELAAPTKKLRAAAEEAGVALSDIDPTANDLSVVLRNLKLVVTDTQDAFTIFGKRGASAALTLLNSVNEFDNVQSKFKVVGLAAELAAIQMEGLGNRTKNMYDKLKNVAIALGDAGLKDVIGGMIDLVRGFADELEKLLRSPMAEFIVKSTIAATSVTLLTTAIGLLIPVVNMLIARLVLGAEFIGGIAAALLTVEGAIISVAAVIAAFTFSETLRKWAGDFVIFGVKVGDVCNAIVVWFEKITDTSKSVNFVNPFALFIDTGRFVIFLLKEIWYWLGEVAKKLLEWGKNVPMLGDFIKHMENAIALSKQQVAIDRGLREVQEKLVKIEKEKEEAVAEVNARYEDQLKVLEKAATKSSKQLEEAKKEFDELIDAFENGFQDLADSVDAYAENIWDGLLNSDVIKRYEAQLNEIKTSTKLSAEELSKASADLGHQMVLAQISAMKEGLSQIDDVYDQQLRTYKDYLDAEIEILVEKGEDRVEIEEEYATKLIDFQKEIYEKKKSYYEKATTALEKELQKSYERERSYIDKIKSIQADIVEARLYGEEKVLAIQRKAMTEEELLTSRRKEYKNLLATAYRLLATDAEGAEKAAKKAVEVAGELITTDKEGILQIAEAERATKKAADVIILAKQEQLRRTQEATEAERSNRMVVEDNFKRIESALKDINAMVGTGIKTKMVLETEQFYSEFNEVKTKLREIEEIKIKVAFDEAALKDLKEEIEQVVQARTLEIDIKGAEEVNSYINSIAGFRETLKEKLVIEFLDNGTLSAASEKLAKMTGMLEEVKQVSPVKIKVEETGTEKTSRQVNELRQAVKDFNANDAKSTLKVKAVDSGESVKRTTEKVETFSNQLSEAKQLTDDDLKIITNDDGSITIVQKKLAELNSSVGSLKGETGQPLKITVDDQGNKIVEIDENMGSLYKTTKDFKAAFVDSPLEYKIVLNDKTGEDSLLIQTRQIQKFSTELSSFREAQREPIKTQIKTEGTEQASTELSGVNKEVGTLKQQVKDPLVVRTQFDLPSTSKAIADTTINLIKEIEKKTELTVNLNVSQAIANAQLLFNKLKEIVDKFDGKVITMTTNWKTTGSPPSTAEGHRTGARIPGYGGGDTVPALLEKGEWIIRKEAVKKYGNNFLAMLNAGMLKAGSMIPRFATGGSVENSNWFQEFKKAYQQKGYSGFGLEEQIWMDRNNGSNPREFVERFIEWLRHFQRRQVDDISFRYGKLNWFDRSWTENYPTEVIPESLRTGPFKPTNIASYIRNMIDWYGYQGAEFLSKGGLVGGLRNIGSLAGSLSSSLMGGVPRGFKTGGLVDAMSGGSSVVSPSYTGRVDFSFGGQTHSMYADSNVARDLVLTLNKMKRRVS